MRRVVDCFDLTCAFKLYLVEEVTESICVIE